MLRKIKELYISTTSFLVSFHAPDDCNDVLIIRLDELGDFIIWLDSAKEYRKIFPNKKITLLVNKKWESLAKEIPYWDEVIGLDTEKFRFNPIYRLRWLRFIRHQNFEITVSPRYFTQFLLEPAIMAICGSEQKIVYGGYFPREKLRYWTKLVDPREGTCHELIRNADFVRALGRTEFEAMIPVIPIPKIQRNNLCKNVVVCTGSFRRDKEWSLNDYIDLIYKIVKSKIPVVICNDKEIFMPHSPIVINLSGKTNLIQFISRINNATLVIGNDSSCIHIATALGIPSVCVGIGKHGKMFHPYVVEQWRGDEVFPKVIWNQDVKSITVDEVWNIVKESI